MVACPRPRLHGLTSLHRRRRAMENGVIAILIALRKHSSCNKEHHCEGEWFELPRTEHNACPIGELALFYASGGIVKQGRTAKIYNFRRRAFLERWAREPAVLLFRPNLCSNCAKSTLRPLKRTPSASRRKRCSRAASPRSEIRPPDPRMRCHGSPPTSRNTRATCRALRGYPAALAIAPYVLTRPRGTLRMVFAIALMSGGFSFPDVMRHLRYHLQRHD
jgi:hypothetical protein